jgi:hypothetical protein
MCMGWTYLPSLHENLGLHTCVFFKGQMTGCQSYFFFFLNLVDEASPLTQTTCYLSIIFSDHMNIRSKFLKKETPNYNYFLTKKL